MKLSIITVALLFSANAHAIDFTTCYDYSSLTVEAVHEAILDLTEKGRLKAQEYENMMRKVSAAQTCDEAVAIAIKALVK